MIILEKGTYELIKSHDNKIRVFNKESIVLCPGCGEKVQFSSTYQRKLKQWEYDRFKEYVYILRKYQCNACNRLHAEIPDIIIPYKQYSKDTIQRAMTLDDMPVEGSTIQRWKKLFID